METKKLVSYVSDSEGRPEAEPEIFHTSTRGGRDYSKTTIRSKLLEKALTFSKTSSYRRYVYSRDDTENQFRNLQRDEIQGEANRALMRKDCLQANYNDYIPSSFDKEVYKRDRLINIPFDEVDGATRSTPSREKTFSISNMKTPFELLNSKLSFNTISLNKAFIKSNFTFNTTDPFSIGTSIQSVMGSSATGTSSINTTSINQPSIGTCINQSSIGSGVNNQIPFNQSIGGINQLSIGSKNENVIVDLIKNGMSPGEVAKLSDVFQYPKCFRKVSPSIIPWLQKQLKQGYWNNNSSLFILCLTMALSVGSVETIFKLNSTWGGLVFLFTYLVSFFFIVQPMVCFELGLGQLFRCSPFEIFEKLVPGMGGVGLSMVILCLLSACIASSRTCSEFFIYFLNLFKKNLPWDLTTEDIEQCANIGGNVAQCNKLSPLCYIVDGVCKSNRLGKAYLAYQNLFDNPDVGMNELDLRLVGGIIVTYILVFILQMIGLTNFTFFAFILVVLIFFLSHVHLYFSMLLKGSTTFLLESITKINFRSLYSSSRLWTHSVRCCIYEYVVGNGIYSTLATKSRIGYDLSSEALGVGAMSGYITSLQFFSALALVGYFCVHLSKVPSDILWMLEQDSSFLLLPMAFMATHNMERTLLVLQFCSCFILITFTLSIQMEVILTTISKFVRVKRVYISLCLCIILVLGCVPLCSKSGKRVIWFLEIAVGDLGRVFMVLMTCIVIGWFYNSREQAKKVGKLSLYLFNSTFWVFNITASLGELLDETLPLYLWWIIRIIGILLATVFSLIVYSFKNPAAHDRGSEYTTSINPNLSSLNLAHMSKANFAESGTKDTSPENWETLNNRTSLETYDNSELNRKNKSRARRRNLLEVIYVLYIGNIEDFRKEFYRISPMNKTNNICWSVVWSISIKWISCCLLSNSLADILEEIISSERVQFNINNIPNNFKIVTIVIWLLLILVILLYPFLKKFISPTSEVNIDLYDLPSYPNEKRQFKLRFRYLFRELF